MPIILSDRTVAEVPRDIPRIRDEFNVPGGECLGCYMGDCAPEMHDIPDACEYLGGFVMEI